MNAEQLLALYDRVAEAPDAIARLRRFVLDLAVRGKLVEQDAGDEPASELLKQIAAEKARLIKTGKFREPRNSVEIGRSGLPFVPPTHWVWARLIDIARPSYGFAFKSSQFNSEKRGMPLIRIRDISKEDTEAYYEGEYEPSYLVRAGDYLVGMDGDFNLRRWTGPDGLLNQRVMRINSWRCKIDPEFVKLPLQMVLNHLHGDTSLTTVKHLSAKQVNGIEIPLPPIAEQQRIVARVDELMALLDRLEAARSEREATRDRLTAASLARLTAPDTKAEAFPDHARFALDTLPALTARPDQIKALRQTILNLAVRGKLVEQDPADEPASELLKRIVAEKEASGKRQKELPEIDPVELGNLPPNWSAVPLIALGDWAIGSGFPKNEQGQTDGPYFFLKVSDMNLPENGKFIKTANNTIDDLAAKRMRVAIHPQGTIIFPKIGGAIATNKRRILSRGSSIDNNCLGITFASDIEVEWAYLLMTTLDFTLYQAGTAVPALQQSTLAAIPIALPPLSEQRRIVTKVDALMALCNQLEVALTTFNTTRARLLEALLHEAITPVAKAVVEAAE